MDYLFVAVAAVDGAFLSWSGSESVGDLEAHGEVTEFRYEWSFFAPSLKDRSHNTTERETVARVRQVEYSVPVGIGICGRGGEACVKIDTDGDKGLRFAVLGGDKKIVRQLSGE